MNDVCIYSDGEIISRGKHSFDKDGYCNICGMNKPKRHAVDAARTICDWFGMTYPAVGFLGAQHWPDVENAIQLAIDLAVSEALAEHDL